MRKRIFGGAAMLCTLGVFGIAQAQLSPPAPNYLYCSGEWGTCVFSGTRTVAFGANGMFAYKTATDGIACTNVAFNADPAPNVVKSCWVTVSP